MHLAAAFLRVRTWTLSLRLSETAALADTTEGARRDSAGGVASTWLLECPWQACTQNIKNHFRAVGSLLEVEGPGPPTRSRSESPGHGGQGGSPGPGPAVLVSPVRVCPRGPLCAHGRWKGKRVLYDEQDGATASGAPRHHWHDSS